MTRDEVSRVLTILRLNYPQSFRNYSNDETYLLLDMWADAFKDYKAEDVVKAVKSIINTDIREFAPNIAQVKARIYDQNHMDLNEYDAWDMVYKAICNGINHAKEEFMKLPEPVQKAVGDYTNIKHWAMGDMSQIPSIQKSFSYNFRKVKECEKVETIERGEQDERIGLPDIDQRAYLTE